MLKDKVIKLNNNQEYYILEELNYENRKYILAAMCKLDDDEMDTENLIVKEIEYNNDELIIVDIEDQKKVEFISKMLITKHNEK